MMYRSSRESGTDRRVKSVLKVGLCLANPAGGVSCGGKRPRRGPPEAAGGGDRFAVEVSGWLARAVGQVTRMGWGRGWLNR